jgi:hypothetical protein
MIIVIQGDYQPLRALPDFLNIVVSSADDTPICIAIILALQ